jgi:hypothetical protein
MLGDMDNRNRDSADQWPTQQLRHRPGRAWRWGAVIVAAAVLAGGGVALASAGNPASPTGQTTGLSGQAATLNTVLSSADSPTTADAAAASRRGRFARLRLMVAGIHGEFTFQARKGGVKTLAFERGTVKSVTSSSVTVAASDGTTWTWHLVSNTVVRQGGKKVGASALADGQTVFAGGPVVSGADQARLIAIRPAQAASAPAS